MRRGRIVFAALFFVSLMLSGPPAHAYIDVLTGSYLFQLIAGGLIAFVVGFRLFGKTIWGVLSLKFFRRSRDTAGTENSPQDD